MRTWLLLLLLLTTPLHAEPVTVDATGTGATREDAVAQGLIEAIQQVTGVVVESVQEIRTAVAMASVDDTHTVALAEAQQGSTRRTANGLVRSFRITDTVSEKPGRVVVHLSVEVEKFQSLGVGTDSRRRIAVASFGGPPGMRPTADLLRDRLAAQLTQSRRFLILDRSNDLVYQQEMAVLKAEAPLAERVRIGQVVGADYAVLGQIRQAGVSRSDRTIQMTGERITNASSAVEIDWSVLEIATRATKFSGTVRLSAGGDGLGDLLDQAAARIADEITQAIYPMRLIRFDDPAELIINQGGGTLQPGQRMRAMLLAEALTDPYTKESLGQIEREIGLIEVLRVDAKISYARLLSGKLPASGAEIVLRPTAALQRPTTAVRPAKSAVVKLPGDP